MTEFKNKGMFADVNGLANKPSTFAALFACDLLF
jgi:hypothetical protein